MNGGKTNEKDTKKILEIDTYMRNTGDFSLDIRYLTANEIGLIKAMISNDAVFEAFVMLQDMDVRDIKIIFDYLTAKDNFEKAGIM